MIIKQLFNEKNFRIIKKKDKNNRDIRVYNLKNVELCGISKNYPYTLLYHNNNDYLTLPINEMTMSTGKKSIYEENDMNFHFINTNVTQIDQDVYFFIYNIQNYYHFLYDTLPYLYCYLEIRKERKIKLLMNYEKLLPFVKESLELLNINESDIINYKDNYSFKSLYISNSLTHDGMSNSPPRKEIFDIYQIMINNALKYNKLLSFPKKIYISRRTWINNNKDNIGTDYTTRRKMMNEDILVENLSRLNFTEFFGENYSMIDKINIFNNCEYVIGAIGGTITNTIFCNKNVKIITIVSPDFLNKNHRMKFLFNKNVKLFNDVKLACKKNTIPPNVRIEITDKNIKEYKKLGEIQNMDNDKYTIRLSNDYNTWKNDDNFKIINLYRNQFKTLDNGINSPYFVDIKSLLEIID